MPTRLIKSTHIDVYNNPMGSSTFEQNLPNNEGAFFRSQYPPQK